MALIGTAMDRNTVASRTRDIPITRTPKGTSALPSRLETSISKAV